jgi:hypothetical protein
MKYAIIKKKFRKTGPTVFGGRTPGYYEAAIDRLVDSEDEIKKGEIYIELKTKE